MNDSEQVVVAPNPGFTISVPPCPKCEGRAYILGVRYAEGTLLVDMWRVHSPDCDE